MNSEVDAASRYCEKHGYSYAEDWCPSCVRYEQGGNAARRYQRPYVEGSGDVLGSVMEERDLLEAALDSLESILFGDVTKRSRDELEERAESLVKARKDCRAWH